MSCYLVFVCLLCGLLWSHLVLPCLTLAGYTSMLTAMYRETYDLHRCAHVGHLARRVARDEADENDYANLFGVPLRATGSNSAKANLFGVLPSVNASLGNTCGICMWNQRASLPWQAIRDVDDENSVYKALLRRDFQPSEIRRLLLKVDVLKWFFKG
jgi:hypothetical protein